MTMYSLAEEDHRSNVTKVRVFRDVPGLFLILQTPQKFGF